MLSVDIVAEEVRKFWRKRGYTCEVIVFFEQKYEHEKEWRQYEEYASPYSPDNFDRVYFPNDFCEGERQVQNVKVMRFETAAKLLRALLEIEAGLKSLLYHSLKKGIEGMNCGEKIGGEQNAAD